MKIGHVLTVAACGSQHDAAVLLPLVQHITSLMRTKLKLSVVQM